MHLNSTELDQIASALRCLNGASTLDEFDVEVTLTDVDGEYVGCLSLYAEGVDGKYAFFASTNLAS